MQTFKLIALIFAAVLFLLAAVNASTRVNLVAAGLFAWILTILVPTIASD